VIFWLSLPELNFKLEKMEEWVQAGGRARERGCSDRQGMDPTPKVDGLFGFKRAAALWQLVINSYQLQGFCNLTLCSCIQQLTQLLLAISIEIFLL
jgi:hypothetical protein